MTVTEKMLKTLHEHHLAQRDTPALLMVSVMPSRLWDVPVSSQIFVRPLAEQLRISN